MLVFRRRIHAHRVYFNKNDASERRGRRPAKAPARRPAFRMRRVRGHPRRKRGVLMALGVAVGGVHVAFGVAVGGAHVAFGGAVGGTSAGLGRSVGMLRGACQPAGRRAPSSLLRRFRSTSGYVPATRRFGVPAAAWRKAGPAKARRNCRVIDPAPAVAGIPILVLFFRKRSCPLPGLRGFRFSFFSSTSNRCPFPAVAGISKGCEKTGHPKNGGCACRKCERR